MKQTEALLALADRIEEALGLPIAIDIAAAAELRRLHEANQMLLEALEIILASTHPYREDGTPTISDATIEFVNAAITKAKAGEA